MRWKLYAIGSVVSAAAVVLRAFAERPNFYSAAVLISSSNGSLMVLANLSILAFFVFVYGLQRLFYGRLRPIEVEQLYEKTWLALTETLLAMTIFRDEFGVWFFAMFLSLLAARVWSWIAEGRLEYLEQQPPANPRLFHIRLTASLLLSVAFNCLMFRYCLRTVLREARPGMMVMFGFEFVLLATGAISTLLKYALLRTEAYIIRQQTAARLEERQQSQREAGEPVTALQAEDLDEDELDVPGWEEKGRYVFILDLVTDFVKSVLYCGFFFMLVAFHGLPLHILRDLFFTLRSFIRRVHDFVQYRNATKDMNERYPDATSEEIEGGNTCIVCRDDMEAWEAQNAPEGNAGAQRRRRDEKKRPKKLPCGHILHLGCLRSWLERQQTCPTCRRSVLAEAQAATGNGGNAGNGANQAAGLFGRQNQQPGNNQGAQQGAALNVGQGAQGPQRNFRVFDLGPFRFGFNRQAVPAHPQQNPVPVQALVQALQAANARAAGALPNQQQILDMQSAITTEILRLESHNAQLGRIYQLLGELAILQQGHGVPDPVAAAPVGNNAAAMLHPSLTTPSAYIASPNTPVMGPGHDPLPPGFSLPEGYTLHRLTPQTIGPQIPALVNSTVHPSATTGPSAGLTESGAAETGSFGSIAVAPTTENTSPQPTEPSSGAGESKTDGASAITESRDREASSSTAGPSEQRVHRTVTIEDAEDSET